MTSAWSSGAGPVWNVAVCRELTKMFESVYEGSVAEILAELMKDQNNLKGEFVVIIKK